MTNLTEDMLKELVEIEEVLDVLDQHACAQGPPLSRAYSRWYNELVKLRDSELRDWNEDASCGLHDRRRMLYRCDNAGAPYHNDGDGPCEVYTPNFAVDGSRAVHLCDLCVDRELEATEAVG
ncbi:hypothetical protein SBA4_1750020 [Candidatus Sulfopaludibacter sp. SbA4]|nr:hypothetical protein SBA4_1750020 [Candidatus Sulfopaludibacter sp. SbA4]